MSPDYEHMRKLCELVSHEQDSRKLSVLVQQLIDELDLISQAKVKNVQADAASMSSPKSA